VTWTLLSSDASGFSDSSSGFTYTLPGGAPAAGVLEVFCVASDDTIASVGAGGGAAWTQLQSYVNFEGAYLYYRITSGSEGTTIVLTSGGSGNASSIHFQRWSGQAASSPLDLSSSGGALNSSGETDTTPSLASGALAGAGELLVAFAGFWQRNNSAGTPQSPAWTGGTVTDDGAGPGYLHSAPNNDGLATWGGYSTNAGPATVSVQVSWTYTSGTSNGTDNAVFLAAFKPGLATSGPNSPSAGTDLGGGTGSWTSPGNITADDGSAATWAVV
jgi:hypothetical protein